MALKWVGLGEFNPLYRGSKPAHLRVLIENDPEPKQMNDKNKNKLSVSLLQSVKESKDIPNIKDSTRGKS